MCSYGLVIVAEGCAGADLVQPTRLRKQLFLSAESPRLSYHKTNDLWNDRGAPKLDRQSGSSPSESWVRHRPGSRAIKAESAPIPQNGKVPAPRDTIRSLLWFGKMARQAGSPVAQCSRRDVGRMLTHVAICVLAASLFYNRSVFANIGVELNRFAEPGSVWGKR